MQRNFRGNRLRYLLLPVLRTISQDQSSIRILDVGGSAHYWQPILSELRSFNCRIVLLNQTEEESALRADTSDVFAFMEGDARAIPLSENSFDLVHSNSVIEHVGTWRDMMKMALEVRRLAKSYFVQVPYFWFPIETHYHAPFIHWLPQQLQARLFMRFGCGGTPRRTVDGAMQKAQYTNLLDCLQFQELFPDAVIARERFCGMTKSLIAIRSPSASAPLPATSLQPAPGH